MLEVSTGDRVRLANTNGDTAEVTVTCVVGDAVITPTNRFLESDGWTVVEVLPKHLPPAGTFVKGVLKNGLKFVGIVDGGHSLYPVATVDESGCPGAMSADEIESWEVLDV